MRRAWIVCLLAFAASFSTAQVSKVKPGDTLSVVTAGQPQYSGDYVVASDGSITVQVIGRIEVGGKTIPEIQRVTETRVRKYVRNADVTVILKLQALQYVYLVSEKVQDGAALWAPGMDIRQLVARHTELLPLDTYTARLYRPGKPYKDVDLIKLMREGDETQNAILEPGDVLSLLPNADTPVWVLGTVQNPGQVRLKKGESIEQAIALAGGQTATAFTNSEVTVTFRRGQDVWKKSVAEVLSSPPVALEAGDTIVVELPRMINVTVGGTVVRSGDMKVREGSGLLAAVEAAGGPKPDGTLERLVLFRKGESQVFDGRKLVQGGTDIGPTLQDGDFLYVPQNLREYHVLGFVTQPGPKLLPDAKDQHLVDALSVAGGLRPNGTYRRVVVMRPAEDGKYKAVQFDLDKYIKNGDLTQNPKIQPGDIVFFDQTSGTVLSDILRVVPGLILLDRFF